MDESKKIRSFTGLDAWKEGHRLVKELFGLTSQLRRAGISFTSDIAEGFSWHSYKEKLQFYSMALGSLTEIQNQLLVARDIGYITKIEFDKIAEQTIAVSKITNGLIKKSRSIIHDS